jgi:hypothetical protein
MRIAHNVALAAGKTEQAKALRLKVLARLNVPVHAQYDNGTKLLGIYHHRGAARSVTMLFEAGRFTVQSSYAVNATVTGRAALSTLPIDPAVPNIASPPVLPTTLWKPGHLYAVTVVYRRRAGHERLTGSFTNGPKRTDGPQAQELVRL